jgi:hypothetical protein
MAALLTIAMAVTFMPSMAFATPPADPAPTDALTVADIGNADDLLTSIAAVKQIYADESMTTPSAVTDCETIISTYFEDANSDDNMNKKLCEMISDYESVPAAYVWEPDPMVKIKELFATYKNFYTAVETNIACLAAKAEYDVAVKNFAEALKADIEATTSPQPFSDFNASSPNHVDGSSSWLNVKIDGDDTTVDKVNDAAKGPVYGKFMVAYAALSPYLTYDPATAIDFTSSRGALVALLEGIQSELYTQIDDNIYKIAEAVGAASGDLSNLKDIHIYTDVSLPVDPNSGSDVRYTIHIDEHLILKAKYDTTATKQLAADVVSEMAVLMTAVGVNNVADVDSKIDEIADALDITIDGPAKDADEAFSTTGDAGQLKAEIEYAVSKNDLYKAIDKATPVPAAAVEAVSTAIKDLIAGLKAKGTLSEEQKAALETYETALADLEAANDALTTAIAAAEGVYADPTASADDIKTATLNVAAAKADVEGRMTALETAKVAFDKAPGIPVKSTSDQTTNAAVQTTPAAATAKAIPDVAKIRTPLTKITLTKGKTYRINYVLDAADGTAIDDPQFTVTAPKAKKPIVSVWSTSSKAFKIRAHRVGTSTITLKAQNGKTLKIKVTVQKKQVKLAKFKAKLPKKLVKGKSYQIKISGLTKNASNINSVIFKSSNESVATVDAAGKVTVLKKGKVKLTIKVGKKKMEKSFTVK